MSDAVTAAWPGRLRPRATTCARCWRYCWLRAPGSGFARAAPMRAASPPAPCRGYRDRHPPLLAQWTLAADKVLTFLAVGGPARTSAVREVRVLRTIEHQDHPGRAAPSGHKASSRPSGPAPSLPARPHGHPESGDGGRPEIAPLQMTRRHLIDQHIEQGEEDALPDAL